MKKIFITSIAILFFGPLIVNIWEQFNTKEIVKTWKQPKYISFGKLSQLQVLVQGNETPIQFFDLDNTFELTITDGGYIFSKEIDLIEGHGNYQSYLDKCKVLWSESHILFVEPNGIELNFPIETIKNRL